MPTLRNLRSMPPNNLSDGSEDPSNSPTRQNSNKKRRNRSRSPLRSPTTVDDEAPATPSSRKNSHVRRGGRSAKTTHRQSTPTNVSPSPYQVMSDLIDATCHEIILLKGDGAACIAPFASYAVLANRLNYYMEKVDHNQDEADAEEDDENGDQSQTVLNDMGVRRRLKMATMTLDVCARLAYPEVFISQHEQPRSNLPPLILLSASQWNKLRNELGKLQRCFPRHDEKVEALFKSLNCQMEAMQALASLMEHLRAVITEIDNDDDGAQSKSRCIHVRSHIEGYKRASDVISDKLKNIHQTSCDDLFVPRRVLSLRLCSTNERIKDSVTTLMKEIDDMIQKNVFPLQSFQVQFVKLLRKWDKSYLSPPALFRVGYFSTGQQSSSTTTAAVGASTPVSPGTSVSSSRRRRAADAKMTNYDDESSTDSGEDRDSNDEKANAQSSPARNRGQKREAMPSPQRKSPGKRRKKIAWTEKEKRTLSKGVKKFGDGKWMDILRHYSDVFEENERTNVDLKDLYARMKK